MATNWAKHIEAQKKSDMSIADYCKAHKLHSPAFYTHRKRLRKPVFAEVQVIDKPQSDSFALTISIDQSGEIEFKGVTSDFGTIANLLSRR